MSFYFRQATVDREPVRAAPAKAGEPHARLWMENEAEALIAEGTASCQGRERGHRGREPDERPGRAQRLTHSENT